MKKILYFFAFFVFLPALMPSQTYNWQWAVPGGGDSGASGSGFNEIKDEMIRDVVVDQYNNSYYLTTIYPGNQNLNGTPVDINANFSDLFLFSLDCNGNIRWTRTIGGYGESEFAWKLSLDDDGGIYLMAYVFNQGHITAPPQQYPPIKWDDNNSMPQSSVPFQDYTTTDPALNTLFLLKYNTTNGHLAWAKPLQDPLGVSESTKRGNNGIWYMDSNNTIHAIIGFLAGSHLDGLINVPASYYFDMSNFTYPNGFQYYLVRFNKVGDQMVPQPNPVLLPITGDLEPAWWGGKVQFLYDEVLERYYLAGSTASTHGSYSPFSFHNISFSNDGYMMSFSVTNDVVTEHWRREFSTYANSNPIAAPNEKIYSLIKDSAGNLYISGRYYQGQTPPQPTFSGTNLNTSPYSYILPINNPATGNNTNFVMKLNSDGIVQWTKIPTSSYFGYNGTPSYRARISLNGNEIAFVKAVGLTEDWDNFTANVPMNNGRNSVLVRLHKDTGNTVGLHTISSDFGSDDELTSIAVDQDGNYVVGGYFQSQLFTDPNDGVPTVHYINSPETQFFAAKLAKSACSQMNTAETPVKQTDVVFYPNPVGGVLHIKTKEKLTSYEVITADGRLMKQGKFSGNYTIDMSGVATGVYYVKVQGENFATAGKVVKK
ncbi:T9SS type A sorting domain-containing protein [Chryseobacterium lacus]|uniref:T9SS C-terminal target domain-containing protein n=1 Tax=Chryseobacterium lacus TaxID=2058346 RepID=A0A368MVB5_9FLAO|nr:T9SS type A sorting domain-containing protein [Chryseobacterium lacus]RCU42118.1 T9SS C-terminal target domain-containing protein [Chryseobacterium lacus]RST26311.1 T9SS type A sorting domain-containing protein [Chryseobacterium lacus]